ncbi:MAG: hypothetical protein ACE15F_10025 [bacterium]
MSGNTWKILIQNNEFGAVEGAMGIGDQGIQILRNDNNGTLNLTADNNMIVNTTNEGIRIYTAFTGSANLNSLIRAANNSFNSIGAAEALYAWTSGNANSCFHITGNTGNGAGGAPSGSIRLHQEGSSILRITQASTANLSTDNNGATVNTGGTISFDGTCTDPPLPTLP